MKKSLISVVELNKLRKDDVISQDEYRKDVVDVFTETLSFNFYEVIERGPFSTILRVWNENTESGLAMKIVLKEELGPKELEWQSLHNRNLLPLLDMEYFPIFDLSWFISPVVELTLEDAIKRKVFHNDMMLFKLAISWLEQITSALNYLHEKQLCFLNLKLSNVMVCKDKSIKLFGFRRLNKTGELTTGYDVPNGFKPPESYTFTNDIAPVEGRTFDIWCLGVLCIEVFTGNYLSRSIPDDICCWTDLVYPQMFKILKKNNFKKECRSAFPKCNIKAKTLDLIRNFSRACLRISPEMRPSTEILLQHKLFKDTGLLAEKDKIWKKQLKPKVMRQKLKNMNVLFTNTLPITSSEAIQTDIQQNSSNDIDDGDKSLPVQQISSISSQNFHEDNEVSQPELLSFAKIEFLDEMLHDPSIKYLWQEMFERTVLGSCQEGFACRVMHTENFVKSLQISIKDKAQNKSDDAPENTANIQNKQKESSKRVNSFGYKIASKLFQFFI